MKNAVFAFLTVALLLGACATEPTHQSFVELNKIYNPDNLPKQTFTINPNSDTVLTGEQGTVLRIGKNTFVDGNGNAIITPITVELREVFNPFDMVMGNLTTTSNGAFLQTGGMLYLNALTNGTNVKIAGGKEIGATVPADTILEGMEIYEGWPLVQSRHGDEPGDINDTSSALNWKNPVPIAKNEPVANDEPAQQTIVIKGDSCNFMFSVDGFLVEPYPKEVEDYVSELCYTNGGIKLTKDSVVTVGKYSVRLHKMKEFYKAPNAVWQTVVGQNTYVEDKNTSYIFSIKKLGWANIDRLYDNPKTQLVALKVNVENNTGFGLVYTTMLVEKMYLPGYQKKDKSYGFTHGDDELTQLPVGEKATIIATAYKGDKVFFAMTKITLKPQQTVGIALEETTVAAMQAKLKANL